MGRRERWRRGLGITAALLLTAAAAGGTDAGLALRAALDAEAAGDADRADALLAEVARAHPVVADHAALLRLRVLLAANRPADAVVAGETALADRDSPLRPRLLARVGEAYAAVGAEPSARQLLSEALQRMRDPAERASVLVALGASLERSGAVGAGAERYLEVWRDYPDQPAAAEAEEALVRLGTARGAGDWLGRAEALYGALRNEAALDAYDRALAGGLEGREREEALQGRAGTLFRLRRYPEAGDAYARLDGSEARIQHARSLARAGRVPEAVASLERLAREGRGSASERARWIAALLLEDETPPDRAYDHFRTLAARARSAEIRSDSRWRLGWEAYRAGRFAEAVGHFEALEALEPDGLSRLQARYWTARALERLGDARAPGILAEMAAGYPLSYYGWRARSRLAEAPAPEPDGLPEPGHARLAPRSLERVRILVEAGLLAEAREEIARLARTRLSLVDRLELARLASDAGDANRAQRLVVDAYQERLARGPGRGAEELWWLAWPWVHSDLVAPEAGGVAPELVYAVMREESGYRPEVVSPVGARGLLQIMPETGSRLARDLGLAFAPDDLFDPAVNLRLGSHYLAELEGRFEGRRSAAVGSYNAGPEAVARWLARDGALEDDEWVETIPYAQTRAYVKRVLRSVFAYEVLY